MKKLPGLAGRGESHAALIFSISFGLPTLSHLQALHLDPGAEIVTIRRLLGSMFNNSLPG
jgi:hypothetical protein